MTPRAVTQSFCIFDLGAHFSRMGILGHMHHVDQTVGRGGDILPAGNIR